MENNDTLNLDALTPSRQTLLTSALVGHSIDVSGGKFSDMSRESLSKIGLTSIEISALEQANQTDGVSTSLRVAESAIPSSDNNPFSQDKWNLEMQRHLHDTKPDLARKLMREAGILK